MIPQGIARGTYPNVCRGCCWGLLQRWRRLLGSSWMLRSQTKDASHGYMILGVSRYMNCVGAVRGSVDRVGAQDPVGAVHPCVRPSDRATICPSIRPSVRPSAHPSNRPPVRPSVHLSDRPTIHPSVWPPVPLSDRPSVCPAVCPSVRPAG